MANAPAIIPPGAEALPDEWRVEVTDGPNKGAILHLEPGSLTLGSGIDNDIVLADGEVAGEQAVLELADGSAQLEALSPGLTVNGAATAPGSSLTVTDGMVLRAGGTSMIVHGPRAPKRRLRWLLLAVPLVLLLGLVSALVNMTAPGKPPDAVQNAPRPAPPSPPIGQARDSLQARLAEAGLGDGITLSTSPGAIVAQGALSAADLAKWQEQQVWFDGQYKGRLSLISRVTQAAVSERPNIQLRAVSSGSVPYIITSNGDRFVEGAVVDGWTIDQITPDKVVFSRDGHTFVINL